MPVLRVTLLLTSLVLGGGCAIGHDDPVRGAHQVARPAKIEPGVVHFRLEARADTAEQAIEVLTQRAAVFGEGLARSGFPEADILATSFSLEGTYSAALELEISIPDRRRASDLVLAAAALGARTVPGRMNALATNVGVSGQAKPTSRAH